MNWRCLTWCLLVIGACAPKRNALHSFESIPESTPLPPLSDWVRESSCDSFEAGLGLLEGGEVALAFDAFDRALWLLLEHRASMPELEPDYRFMIDRIHEMSRGQSAAPEQRVAYDVATLERLLEGGLTEAEIEHIGEQNRVVDESNPFPIVINRAVERFIHVFSNERADVIQASLDRSVQYVPLFREILSEKGLPIELAYLPLIESGYKTHARSRASAVGMWQFMKGTGRDFGLRTDVWLDQRLDPVESANAAADYLSALYDMFGDWYLALAAYNAGPGRVRSAIRRGKSRDFWQLARKRLFPRETIGYIPAFLAALEITKKPAEFGFVIKPETAFEFDEIPIDYGVELDIAARYLGLSSDLMANLNPALIRGMTPLDGSTYRLKVPAGYGVSGAQRLAEIPENERVRALMYAVRRGDTLSRIAAKHGITQASLQSANRLRNPNRLSIGQELIIPLGGNVSDKWRGRAYGGSLPQAEIKHRVRRGDTLSRLAHSYQTTVASIMALNPDIRPQSLQVGTRLRISQGSSARTSGRVTHYTVVPGDTLEGIARRFRTSVTKIVRANKLRSAHRISAGQRLSIPQ